VTELPGIATASSITEHPDLSPVIQRTMARAVKLAKRGPVANPNPRVGAVILNQAGEVLGEGWHRGAGTPHAEVAAMADAATNGHDVRGAILVVTLEPCNHQGFTGPCAVAIVNAGIAKVSYAVPDPGATSSGGAATLAANGVEVQQLPCPKAEKLVRIWAQAIKRGRPYVTLKLATTLDGKVAAADGTSKWITGPEARQNAHNYRSKVGAIAVTTGTVLADDPALTARNPDGSLAGHQPLAVVIGQREIPETAKIRTSPGGFVQFKTHDVEEVLAQLHQRGVRHLLVEGGPALVAAFLQAAAVDELHAYLAPKLLGSGKSAVGPFGINTISAAPEFQTVKTKRLGNDIFLSATIPPSVE